MQRECTGFHCVCPVSEHGCKFYGPQSFLQGGTMYPPSVYLAPELVKARRPSRTWIYVIGFLVLCIGWVKLAH